MKVHGVEIPKEAIESARERMTGGEFQARDIVEVVMPFIPANVRASGCMMQDPRGEIAHRAVDRLIQKERKAKNIRTTTYPKWEWCGNDPGPS